MTCWKFLVAHLVILALVGCTSTARMTALDRSLVNKKITRTSTGGVQIDMDGNFLLNPTAAVETFHTMAEKELAGRPYRYTYTVDKKQATRRVYEGGSSSGADAGGSSYTPVFYPMPSSGGGVGGGEAAIILGSIALILVLAKLAADSRKEKAAPAPAPSPAPAQPVPAYREETVTTRILRVSGTAEPVAPISLDRGRMVEVLPPQQAPVIGRLKPAVAAAIGEEVRAAFAATGCPVSIGSFPAQQGYQVSTTVLRAQGTPITYSALTVEVTLTDERTGRELARWLVQAAEKPFDIKSQNERLYGPGIATSILRKPMQAQVARHLR